MNVIKESFDNLPAAVCIFNDKGLVRLMNHRMLMVGAMFFGSGVQTPGELQAALKQPPAGVTADLAMPGVYHFPDGSILRFSERKITDRDGQRCTEVIASDVSALMEVRTELHRENERLDAANQKLRKLGEDLADIVREEEILRMKIRVHDDIGYSLLSVRRAFWQCDDLSALHALSEQWRTTIRLLHAEGREPPGDALVHAKLRAKELGAEVTFTGIIPEEPGARELFSLAIRECTSNCLRHAGGRRTQRPAPPYRTGTGHHAYRKQPPLCADDYHSHTGGTHMTHVLIVEDQTMVRKLLESYVEKEPGFASAGSVPGANAAPELCRQQQIDLILMDVQTENRENGLSAAVRIKREHPHIRIVIVTSLIDGEILRQAKALGADSLWYKDGSRDQLMDVVRRTLNGEHIFPDAPPVTRIGTACSSKFTGAEMRVLRCLVQGMSYTATAEALGVDARTVKYHVSSMLQKTNFENKLQLAVAAIETRLTANFPEE